MNNEVFEMAYGTIYRTPCTPQCDPASNWHEHKDMTQTEKQTATDRMIATLIGFEDAMFSLDNVAHVIGLDLEREAIKAVAHLQGIIDAELKHWNDNVHLTPDAQPVGKCEDADDNKRCERYTAERWHDGQGWRYQCEACKAIAFNRAANSAARDRRVF